jgi:DNA-3-methyladenine glycosylase I
MGKLTVKKTNRVISPDLVIGEDGLARPEWATVGILRSYYDSEWGVPIRDEQGIFEKICLEVFQSGLSWVTVLRKREDFRLAFENFNPDVVAKFSATDVDRLMADTKIVRNRAKIAATISNAIATIQLRHEGGLAELVWSFRPRKTPEPFRFSDIPTSSEESSALSITLRKHGFKFVGPTNMYALMEAVGIVDTHLLGSHKRGTSGVWAA